MKPISKPITQGTVAQYLQSDLRSGIFDLRRQAACVAVDVDNIYASSSKFAPLDSTQVFFSPTSPQAIKLCKAQLGLLRLTEPMYQDGSSYTADVVANRTGTAIAMYFKGTEFGAAKDIDAKIVIYDENYNIRQTIPVRNASLTLHFAIDDKGERIAISTYDTGLQIFDIATGAELYQTLDDQNNNWVEFDGYGNLWRCPFNTQIKVIAPDFTLKGQLDFLGYINNYCLLPSPDGKHMMVAHSEYDLTIYDCDTLDLEGSNLITYPNAYTSADPFYAWLDNNSVYIAGNNDPTEYILDGTWKLKKQYHYGFDPLPNRATVFARYKCEGSFSDIAGETQYQVLVINKEGVIESTTNLPTGITTYSVPAIDASPKTIIVKGIATDTRSTEWDYLVGEIIVVGDASYECTTAGTTATVAPAYPSSGTVTDGTAVFTFRSVMPAPQATICTPVLT